MSSRAMRRSAVSEVSQINVSSLRNTATRAGTTRARQSSIPIPADRASTSTRRGTPSVAPATVTTRATSTRTTTRRVLPTASSYLPPEPRVSITRLNRRLTSVTTSSTPYNSITTRRLRIELSPLHSPLEQTQENVMPRRSGCGGDLPPISPKPDINRRSLGMVNIYYCPICFTSVRKQDGLSLIGTACGHLFCEECILQALAKRSNCPLCSSIVSKAQLREFFI